MITDHAAFSSEGERFALYRAPENAATATFADDVRAGFAASPKRMSPKYFYDELGSALFEAICALPEYYLTRTEAAILDAKAHEIASALAGPIELVELGSGSARKTRALIEATLALQPRLTYHPIDISPSALVGSYDRLDVVAYASDYTDVLAAGRLRTTERVLALFLGSNLGNYEPHAAEALLSALVRALRPGDGILLGTDLKKDAPTLERAYNDPTGVTAAFDKNLLGRINRELGGRFDLDAFEHVARYDARRGVVESFLVARRGMNVRIDALDLEVRLVAGESIHTESSYKFDAVGIAALAARSGARVERRWTDDGERFALTLIVVD